MAKPDAPLSFADLIESAQKTPPRRVNPGTHDDLSSPFPSADPPDHRVVDLTDVDPEKIPGVAEYSYEAHVEHFCLPQDIVGYQNVLNKVLNAKAILRYEDRSLTKDGDCIIVICYLTYTANRRAERLRRDNADDI